MASPTGFRLSPITPYTRSTPALTAVSTNASATRIPIVILLFGPHHEHPGVATKAVRDPHHPRSEHEHPTSATSAQRRGRGSVCQGAVSSSHAAHVGGVTTVSLAGALVAVRVS